MARQPKPWFRKDRDCWFVTIQGTRHNLGPDKKQAFVRFYELMRQPKSAPIASEAFAAIADAFLDWVEANRAPDTYEWYRYRLERFCQRYPDLIASKIKPFHVQTWVDSYTYLSKTSRRNYIRSVKRCVKWAHQQGYLSDNPIEALECPGAESKEVVIPQEEFDEACKFMTNTCFRTLCQVSFETGCRPQEILRVEARHVDIKNARWVLPPSESKGKKKPRIVYLTPFAKEVTRQLCNDYPSGPLFRNTKHVPWTTDAVGCAFMQLQVRMGRNHIDEKGIDIDQLAMSSYTSGKPVLEYPERERAKIRRKICRSFAQRFSLYSFRHSWATRALQSGLDALTVAVLMGHNDPSTLSRVYQHLSHNPEHLGKQVASVMGCR